MYFIDFMMYGLWNVSKLYIFNRSEQLNNI